jgi:prohibitin 2
VSRDEAMIRSFICHGYLWPRAKRSKLLRSDVGFVIPDLLALGEKDLVPVWDHPGISFCSVMMETICGIIKKHRQPQTTGMMFASNAVEVKHTYVPPTQVEELGNRSPKNPTTASDKKKFSFGWSDRDKSPEGVRLRKRCLWAFALCVLATAIGLLATSLKKVESTEYGLQYNIHKKTLDDASKSGGLFAGPPGYEFIKFPSTFITVDLDDRTCVSNDGLLVDFSVTFQYQMTEVNLLPAVLKYRDFDKWADTVEEAGLSAIHHSCSEFQVTEFQSKRGIIQNQMIENLKLKLAGDPERGLDGVNAVAVSLQLRFIGLPSQYNDAVAEKQAAEEDIALAVAQRKQETTKANTDLLRAKEEARKIMDTAVNEAEVLLTESQLKAEETLFSFEKEADALVQVKEALGLTSEGVLAYLSNMLLSEVSNLVVTTGEPAQLSRKDLL